MTNPNQAAGSELLPCPFCGEALYQKRRPMNPYAVCKTDGCKGAQLPMLNIDDPDDVTAWNRRTPAQRDQVAPFQTAPVRISTEGVASVDPDDLLRSEKGRRDMALLKQLHEREQVAVGGRDAFEHLRQGLFSAFSLAQLNPIHRAAFKAYLDFADRKVVEHGGESTAAIHADFEAAIALSQPASSDEPAVNQPLTTERCVPMPVNLLHGLLHIIDSGVMCLGAVREARALLSSPAAQGDAVMVPRELLSRLVGYWNESHDIGAPDHSHEIPGVWDLDNKPSKAGKPCQECADYDTIRALLGAKGE